MTRDWTLLRCSTCGVLESDLRASLVVERDTGNVVHVTGVSRCGTMVDIPDDTTPMTDRIATRDQLRSIVVNLGRTGITDCGVAEWCSAFWDRPIIPRVMLTVTEADIVLGYLERQVTS